MRPGGRQRRVTIRSGMSARPANLPLLASLPQVIDEGLPPPFRPVSKLILGLAASALLAHGCGSAPDDDLFGGAGTGAPGSGGSAGTGGAGTGGGSGGVGGSGATGGSEGGPPDSGTGGSVDSGGSGSDSRAEGTGGTPGSNGVSCGDEVCIDPDNLCCVGPLGGLGCQVIDSMCTGSPIACDGPEDCRPDQVCCGRTNSFAGALFYERVRCESNCEGTNLVPFCGGNASICQSGTTCQPSGILPQYLVCRN